MKKLFSKLICIVLAISMLSSMLSASAALLNGFERSITYTYGMFDDVDESGAWYGADNQHVIKDVYELGIMDGTDWTKFEPESNLTTAQAVTMGARVHAIYYGNTLEYDEDAEYWFEPYVTYARQYGLIDDMTTPLSDPSWDENALRWEMASIFARAVPSEELDAINNIDSVVDYTDTETSEPILTLYRAGVLAGNDEQLSFLPYNPITRAEAAAIISRIAITDNRESFAPIQTEYYQEGIDNKTLFDTFVETAMSDGFGEEISIMKWENPIVMYVDGTMSETLEYTVNDIMTTLNGIENFPGISVSEEPENANLFLMLYDTATIEALCAEYEIEFTSVDGVLYVESEGSSCITSAELLIDYEAYDEVSLNVITAQLMLFSVGLIGMNSNTSSVAYIENTTNYTLGACDIGMLRLLYNENILIGAEPADAKKAAESILGLN